MQEFYEVHTVKQPKSYDEMYERVKSIGMGAFGEAVLVRQKDLAYNHFYIAKHILLDKIAEEERASVKNESEILKELNSDHVVKYINSYQDNDKKLIIVMEYCEFGDMTYQIKQRKNKNQKYSEDEIMYWFSQLVLAMRDIHKTKVMHKDIKTLNVFLAKGNRPLIGDFGVSAINEDPTNEKGC